MGVKRDVLVCRVELNEIVEEEQISLITRVPLHLMNQRALLFLFCGGDEPLIKITECGMLDDPIGVSIEGKHTIHRCRKYGSERACSLCGLQGKRISISKAFFSPRALTRSARGVGEPTAGRAPPAAAEPRRRGGLILEAIYEPMFSDQSHGFRPGRSCHTALESLRRNWVGTKWTLKIDIAECFDPAS